MDGRNGFKRGGQEFEKLQVSVLGADASVIFWQTPAHAPGGLAKLLFDKQLERAPSIPLRHIGRDTIVFLTCKKAPPKKACWKTPWAGMIETTT